MKGMSSVMMTSTSSSSSQLFAPQEPPSYTPTQTQNFAPAQQQSNVFQPTVAAPPAPVPLPQMNAYPQAPAAQGVYAVNAFASPAQALAVVAPPPGALAFQTVYDARDCCGIGWRYKLSVSDVVKWESAYHICCFIAAEDTERMYIPNITDVRYQYERPLSASLIVFCIVGIVACVIAYIADKDNNSLYAFLGIVCAVVLGVHLLRAYRLVRRFNVTLCQNELKMHVRLRQPDAEALVQCIETSFSRRTAAGAV